MTGNTLIKQKTVSLLSHKSDRAQQIGQRVGDRILITRIAHRCSSQSVMPLRVLISRWINAPASPVG